MESVLKVLVWTTIVLAVLCGCVFIFVEPWTVPVDDPRLATSLEPNVHAGDSLLVTRASGASYGKLVRCPDPTPGADRWVVGRVVATAGQTFQIAGGSVRTTQAQEPARRCDVQEHQVKNPTTGALQKLSCRAEEIGHGTEILYSNEGAPRERRYTVEAGRVFLVSDNRYFHNDSQDIGQIDPATCQTVFARLVGGEGWGDAKNRLNVLY